MAVTRRPRRCESRPVAQPRILRAEDVDNSISTAQLNAVIAGRLTALGLAPVLTQSQAGAGTQASTWVPAWQSKIRGDGALNVPGRPRLHGRYPSGLPTNVASRAFHLRHSVIRMFLADPAVLTSPQVSRVSLIVPCPFTTACNSVTIR